MKKGVGTNGETNGVNGATNGITNGATNGVVNGVTNGANGHHHKTPYPYDTATQAGNPTVVPAEILKQFHFTFLIRHPRHSIPSYWRCTIDPLDKVTGFYDFMPSEAGYDELRRVFDFLRKENQVGPSLAGEHGKLKGDEVSITVVDADDLLDNPAEIIEAYCREVGIEYIPDMLNWDSEDDHQHAKDAFEKWRGFHEDAIHSTSLKPRSAANVSFLPGLKTRKECFIFSLTRIFQKKKEKTVAVEDEDWREKYGKEAARTIRETINANIADYEYLKSFAIKV